MANQKEISLSYEALTEALAVGILHGMHHKGKPGEEFAVLLGAVGSCLEDIYKGKVTRNQFMLDVAQLVTDESIRNASPLLKPVLKHIKKNLNIFSGDK